MTSFREALRAINAMRDEGVIEDYAVAGAMAVLFWVEPIPTYDLDVLVFLPGTGGLILSLEPIYEWASRHGYPAEATRASGRAASVGNRRRGHLAGCNEALQTNFLGTNGNAKTSSDT